MRQIAFMGLILFACLCSGCVYSVHPLLKDSDLTTDMDLSGTWKPIGGQTIGVTAPEDLKGYTFTAQKYSAGCESDYDIEWNGKEFHGQIGKLGDNYYIQLKRTELTPEIPPLLHAVPVYAIAKLKVTEENKLEIFVIDELQAPLLLKEHKLENIRYSPSDLVEFFVMTESTESMQSTFRQASEQIFKKRMVFSRDNIPTEVKKPTP